MKMKGKKIKVFFDDGEKIAWREGILTSKDDFSVVLDDKNVIPISRVIRMEVVENGCRY
jgi:sRNA-binding regulator protein Hfq